MKTKYLVLIILLSICCFGSCKLGQGVTTNTTEQITSSDGTSQNNANEDNAEYSDNAKAETESLPPNGASVVDYSNEKPYKDLITIPSRSNRPAGRKV